MHLEILFAKAFGDSYIVLYYGEDDSIQNEIFESFQKAKQLADLISNKDTNSEVMIIDVNSRIVVFEKKETIEADVDNDELEKATGLTEVAREHGWIIDVDVTNFFENMAKHNYVLIQQQGGCWT